MSEQARCEAGIMQSWHEVRCGNKAKFRRGKLRVCGVHDRSRTVRLFTGCGCFIHATDAAPSTNEGSEG